MQVRELRANLAAALRRAEAGERVVVTVGGRPVAQLGPIETANDGVPTLDDLAATGLVVRARRDDHPEPDIVLALPVGARLDKLFEEIRGVTLFMDSTALLARHVGGPSHAVVVDACATDADWCASALARMEALALIERVTVLAGEQRELRRALGEDWDCVNVVPVDTRCLDRAVALARAHPLRVVDALHLAAADRLPRPVTYCTFDPNQIPVALALGFEVASI